ncbi:hypothetical protein ACVGWY_20260, partial [Enterobacter intestinihominis]
AIHRGERRVLQSVVIPHERDEKPQFAPFDAADLRNQSHHALHKLSLKHKSEPPILIATSGIPGSG